MDLARLLSPRVDDITRSARATRAAACLAWLLASGPVAAAGSAPGVPWHFDGVDRVVAISDIHGAYQAFVETLQAAGVVDQDRNWAAGKTHLVIVGDMVDRGDDSRATMDLLMRLEPQAAGAGGEVHVVLGNHEMMNLVGDLRYVSKGEFAAFAPEESAAMRADAYRHHASRRGFSRLSRAEFDDRFPPGFFSHRAAFAASGRYGRWLLGKPVALRIDDTLYLHAGASPAIATMSGDEINGPLRGDLVEYVSLLERLVARGALDATVDFYDVPAALEDADARNDPVARRLLALHESMLYSASSPLWYRGNVGCGPLVEQDRLAASLEAHGARRVVIGHTPTLGRRVWRRLDGRVWLIDAGMLNSYYSGQGAALLLEHGEAAVVYQGSSTSSPVEELAARAGVLSAGLAPEDLEAALATGEIEKRESTRDGDLLSLRWHGLELQAVFSPADGKGETLPEVAAYRVDRLLDLAMVPAAVARSVEGRRGSVQYRPQSLVSEKQRAGGKVRIDAWCPLPDQWQAMYLFDALIARQPRPTAGILYHSGTGQLVLTGHESAFGTDSGIPAHLKKADLGVNALWRRKLAALDSDEARSQLLEVLSGRQYEALLQRAVALAQ
jgi:hypothetical protein